jgi:RES domain-containing protein
MAQNQTRKRSLGRHASPPRDFATRPLLLTIYRQPWFRIHQTALNPLYFGRSGNHRFDAPAGQFGVLYLGRDEHCAFIETFGHATGVRFVDRAELLRRSLARIVPKRPLRLLDLSGKGLARLGADARLTTGESYAPPQSWARAIHDHRQQPDGIVYSARHDPSRRCAAVFDRVAADFDVDLLGCLADPAHAQLLGGILDTYDFGIT